MLIATQTDLLWTNTDAQISLFALKVGTLMQVPASAPITLRLTPCIVLMLLHQSSSLREWMGGEGRISTQLV